MAQIQFEDHHISNPEQGARKSLFGRLYVQVLLAIALGILLGHFDPRLGAQMKPMVKDADGKVKADLPKPGKSDDATKAGESVAAWKLMKKQIKEVVSVQSARLEQAMVTGRR